MTDLKLDELEAYRAALVKIDAIRNSIVGFQTVHFSEHVYPLVAALEEAGFKGEPYEKCRDDAGTLIEQIKDVEARLRSSEAESDRRGKALEEAEKTFRWYGDLHAAKPDEAKARRNYELADTMAAALQPKTGEDA